MHKIIDGCTVTLKDGTTLQVAVVTALRLLNDTGTWTVLLQAGQEAVIRDREISSVEPTR